MNGEKVRVVGLSGSLRSQSYARMAVETALEGARQAGAEAHLLDLREYELVFNRGKDEEADYPEDVFRLRRDVGRAQGIILGTPEYHGSFSGVLKNALDLMGFDEFEGKMVGLVGVSGGRLGAASALSGLRDICRALHAWVVPEQASIPRASSAFGEDGRPVDEELAGRLVEVGRQVASFACLHNAERAHEFLCQWEEAIPNPGGGRRE